MFLNHPVFSGIYILFALLLLLIRGERTDKNGAACSNRKRKLNEGGSRRYYLFESPFRFQTEKRIDSVKKEEEEE